MVTGMLQGFSIYFYALLYAGATLSFVTLLVTKKFYILLDVLIKPFSVTTPVGDSVVARKVFKNFPISLTNRVTWMDLLELDMVDFNVILGMDWSHLVLLPLIVGLG